MALLSPRRTEASLQRFLDELPCMRTGFVAQMFNGGLGGGAVSKR
jgi:hypothetical protein